MGKKEGRISKYYLHGHEDPCLAASGHRWVYESHLKHNSQTDIIILLSTEFQCLPCFRSPPIAKVRLLAMPLALKNACFFQLCMVV